MVSEMEKKVTKKSEKKSVGAAKNRGLRVIMTVVGIVGIVTIFVVAVNAVANGANPKAITMLAGFAVLYLSIFAMENILALLPQEPQKAEPSAKEKYEAQREKESYDRGWEYHSIPRRRDVSFIKYAAVAAFAVATLFLLGLLALGFFAVARLVPSAEIQVHREADSRSVKLLFDSVENSKAVVAIEAQSAIELHLLFLRRKGDTFGGFSCNQTSGDIG